MANGSAPMAEQEAQEAQVAEEAEEAGEAEETEEAQEGRQRMVGRQRRQRRQRRRELQGRQRRQGRQGRALDRCFRARRVGCFACAAVRQATEYRQRLRFIPPNLSQIRRDKAPPNISRGAEAVMMSVAFPSQPISSGRGLSDCQSYPHQHIEKRLQTFPPAN